MMTPDRRSLPVKTMEIIYDLILLHLYIEKEAIASLARNRYCMLLDWPGQNEKRKTYIGLLKYWNYKLQEINIEIDENYKISNLIWHKLYTINVDNKYTTDSKSSEHLH